MLKIARFFAFCFGLAASSPGLANPLLVAELSNGRVIFSREATRPWNPASVTKLMTAYVAFKAVKDGEIGFATPITVSQRAESMEKTLSGARPGSIITLDAALKFMLVQSANDMAIAIAEGVGGTVETFVDRMNEEARRIGLKESRFFNPNGLFHPGQHVSARDMALLVRRLLADFPDYQGYFRIPAIATEAGLRTNTNGLIGRYPGADGMKTGFICPAGFNLVATATRNGRRLVAVVLGAENAEQRVLKAARLLDLGFSSGIGRAERLDELPPSAIAEAPDLRLEICAGKPTLLAREDDLPPNGSVDLSRRTLGEAVRVAFGPSSASPFAPPARNGLSGGNAGSMNGLKLASSQPVPLPRSGATKSLTTSSIETETDEPVRRSTFGMLPSAMSSPPGFSGMVPWP